MNKIIQGQNTPLLFNVTGEIADADSFSAALYQQGAPVVEWDEADITDDVLQLLLGQDDTLALKAGRAVLDIKFAKDGVVYFEQLKDYEVVPRPNKTEFDDVEASTGTGGEVSTLEPVSMPIYERGLDGVSPTVSISKTGKVSTVTITDGSGAHTTTINDGNDGTTPTVSTTKTGDTTTVVFRNGNVVTATATIKDGAKGDKGDTGEPGAAGSDASVTSQNIANALGYEPADNGTVASIEENIATNIEPAISQINEDIAEKVSDVKINGTSILDDDKVANIPIASTSNLGVFKPNSTRGTEMRSNNTLAIKEADINGITSRTQAGASQLYGAITSGNLVPAVNSVICSTASTEQLGTEEKVCALNRLGAEPKHNSFELIETITLTEDIQEISRTSEPSGTPYTFKDVYVLFSMVSGYTNNQWVYCDVYWNKAVSINLATSNHYAWFRNVNASTGGYVNITTTTINGLMSLGMSNCSTNPGFINVPSTSDDYAITKVIVGDAVINKLILKQQTKFLSGTKIMIYGVRS